MEEPLKKALYKGIDKDLEGYFLYPKSQEKPSKLWQMWSSFLVQILARKVVDPKADPTTAA